MTPLGKSKHVAARMGRWSASHWKTATFGWIAFVVAAFAIGTLIGTKNIDEDKAGSGESGHVTAVLADEFKQSQVEDVLVQSTSSTVSSPAFRGAIADVTAMLQKQKAVYDIESPLVAGNEGQISRDRRSALVEFKLRGTDLAKADKEVAPVEKAVAVIQKAHPELFIGQFGGASADRALNAKVGEDFAKAGQLSLPVTLAILLVAFGALIAAGLPILLSLTAVIGTMGLLAIPSHVMPIDKDSSVIVLLIGLAVGVDYSMFYLKRERQERRSGKSERAALEAAAATSGRAVLVSGLTVMIAMAGMFFTGNKSFESFGLATMMVVAVAVLGSLTVLPALLAKLGDRVDKPRIPFMWRLQRRDGESRLWNAILNPVLRHPVVATVVASGALIALAVPALHMHTANPGVESVPKSLPIMKVYNRLEAAFPGQPLSAAVMVKVDDTSTEPVRREIAALRRDAVASGQFHEPTQVDVNEHGTIAVVSLPIAGNGTDAASNHALEQLRSTIIPNTVGKLAGADVGVAGDTAESYDFNTAMKHAAPFVFAFVLGFAFILLLLTFRSIVIAVKAILLNLLSVAASYGALVLIFQHGWGKGVLGFDYTGGIVSFLPIFLFVILFGLSMDYHVFILSRVREAYDRGMKTEDAVAYGIKSTASVVTSAAIVMVAVFSIFGTLSFLFLKQFGIGLAIAVLIDATIVRAVLLPAVMKLLGDANWYLPAWLEWMPQVRHEVEPRPAATAA
jgi:RND superfamily putative drug exporter